METEPILIKDEETAENVWKTDPQDEFRITGEGGCDHKGYCSLSIEDCGVLCSGIRRARTHSQF